MSDSCIVAKTAQAAFLVSGLIPRRACSHFARGVLWHFLFFLWEVEG